MTREKGLGNDVPSCHCEARRAEAIPRSNPKLKALNSKQILISKFKTQNPFGHLDFGHLILFSISDLVFRILFFEIATLPLHYVQGSGSPQ
jgi:hypothetical protein